MKFTLDNQHTMSRQRRALLSGSVLLSFAIAAGACSSNGTASPGTTVADKPTSTSTTATSSSSTTDAPSTTEASVPDGSATPPANTEAGNQSKVDSTRRNSDGAHEDRGAADDVFSELDALDFTGTVIADTPEGVVGAAFGLADRSADIDNTLDTVFDIGSITKQFTAAAILRLEMDRRLSVDHPIGQYLDGLTPAQSEITLHQLLTHTSGLPHGIGPDDEVISLPEFLDRLATSTYPASPVGEYLYSNVGYSLLGAVVEMVTGDSYEAYLRDALFEPAGMLRTGYVLADWTDATIAVGYNGDEIFGRPNERPWGADGPGWNLRGNGGLLSTMPDLLRWDAALTADEILDAEAKAKMYIPYVEIDAGDGAFSGYGWNLVPFDDGTMLITHAGGNGTFYADFSRFVDHDVTIVLASNVADPLAFDVGTRLADALLPDLFEDGVCELDPMTAEATAGLDIIDDYPDTPAGRGMATWIDVVLSGSSENPHDESVLADYVEQSIGEGFIEELGSETVAGLIRSLQDQLVGFEVERIARQDDTTFHVVVADTNGNQAVLSVRLEATPESRIDCIGFSN